MPAANSAPLEPNESAEICKALDTRRQIEAEAYEGDQEAEGDMCRAQVLRDIENHLRRSFGRQLVQGTKQRNAPFLAAFPLQEGGRTRE
jgi:hypothetical protein